MKTLTLAEGLFWLFDNNGTITSKKERYGLLVKFQIQSYCSTITIPNEIFLIGAEEEKDFGLTVAINKLYREVAEILENKYKEEQKAEIEINKERKNGK